MTIDRTALRALAARAREDHELVLKLVGPCVAGDGLALADGIDALLAEVERLEEQVEDLRMDLAESNRFLRKALT